MTLTEFLLARIAEDEDVARAAQDPFDSMPQFGETAFEVAHDLAQSEGAPQPGLAHIARNDPARVLLRCKADRQLLELHADNGTIPGKYELRCYACDSDYPCDTLKIMASPYADHPNFHPGWK